MRLAMLMAAGSLYAGLAAAAFGTTLVFCSEGSPEGFDPALYTSGTTFDASSETLYDRLVEFETGTTRLVPGLAESWEVSGDGLVYTFHLRRGVAFHATAWFTPSRPFNAEDVLFSLGRQLDAEHPYHAAGGFPYFAGMGMPELLAAIERVDEHTVRFVLHQPSAPFVSNLAMDFASILSAEYAGQMLAAGRPERLDEAPVGTGAFLLDSYAKDAGIRYRAHAGYWRQGQPGVDQLDFVIIPDSSDRYAKLVAGECHVMPYPNPADLPAMRAEEDILVLEQEGLNVGYLAYNTTRPPFDNVRVRRALNMAFDKQAILDEVFRGTGQVAINPIPPGVWSYHDGIEDDPHDPERARQILAEEGVADLQMKIWAMPVQRPYNPDALRMAELMQADLAEIGVRVEIVSYEWGEYLRRSRALDRDGAILLGWTGDNGDPDNFLSVLLGCAARGNSNRAQWCHEPFDSRIRQARVTTDRAERTRLYREAQEIFKQQAPWATVAHSVVHVPIRREVTGYRVNPFGTHNFREVGLEP